MTDPLTIAELEQQAALHRSRVLEVAAEIKALLAEDLPKYVERELKRAFVSAPDFAATLDDETLRSLKEAIRSRRQSRTGEVLAALDLEDQWFPADATADDERKSISENEPLWTTVNAICDVVTELRQEYGFPAASEPIEYRPPTWFIGRRYLPSLSEKYWRHVTELAEVESQIGAINDEVSRADLTARWDALE